MRYTLLIGILLLAGLAWGQVDLVKPLEDNKNDNTLLVGYQFEPVIEMTVTPVENQGASGTCWSYCSSSFLESEMIRTGRKPVDLSEMFTVRKVYEEKAVNYVRMHGSYNFGEGGALPDVVQIYGKYGAVPESVYQGLNYGTDINRHGEMQSMLKAMVDAVVANPNKQLTPVWKEAVSKVLDVYLGEYPSEFEYGGKTYTPTSFAEEVIGLNADDYLQISSFTHQPFYKPFTMMVPDNWAYGLTYNVPLDELTVIIDHALLKGYTVAWATDVSEKYFSWRNGIAYVPEKEFNEMCDEERINMFKGPKPERVITPEMRQEAYDNYTTSDDHGMHIVGLVKDQTGAEWYKVKNSWGENNDYKGFLYVSKNYVRYKSISILLHKDGVPKEIRKKLEI
ncbi:MAG: aminopeptidase [Lewinellaceae bacterium]|nr:aminopeptidase [Lewinellaceae bacterium]